MDVIGDLGGVMDIFILIAGVFVCPVTEFSYYMTAFRNLFLARTSDSGIFKTSSKGKKKRGTPGLKRWQSLTSEMKKQFDTHYAINLSYGKWLRLLCMTKTWLTCCFRRKSDLKLLDMYERCEEKFDKMLGIERIFKHLRISHFMVKASK